MSLVVASLAYFVAVLPTQPLLGLEEVAALLTAVCVGWGLLHNLLGINLDFTMAFLGPLIFIGCVYGCSGH
jgi:hypothetical protein